MNKATILGNFLELSKIDRKLQVNKAEWTKLFDRNKKLSGEGSELIKSFSNDLNEELGFEFISPSNNVRLGFRDSEDNQGFMFSVWHNDETADVTTIPLLDYVNTFGKYTEVTLSKLAKFNSKSVMYESPRFKEIVGISAREFVELVIKVCLK